MLHAFQRWVRALTERVTRRTPGARPGPLRADRAGREDDEPFVRLVAGVRDYAMVLLDRDGHVRTWNAGAARIQGYRAEEILGEHVSRFHPSEAISSGRPARELRVAAQTGRFEDEGWRIRQDGARFWANVVITALYHEDGSMRGFLHITRDLTERKLAEEELRVREERIRLLVDRVEDYAIFMLDPDGHVATWNTGAERLKGYSAAEIIGRHFSVFYPGDAADRGWPAFELEQAAQAGRFEDEGWRVRKDGTRFWANVVITALRDDDGELRGYAKVTRDLTERRQAEENARRLLQEETARQAAERAAREIERQREQLHVTLASIGDAVIVTDNAGNVTFLNQVAAALTGWSVEEASGQPLEQVFCIINEISRQPVENPVVRVCRERAVVGLANQTALVGRGGKEVPIEDTAAPILRSDNELLGAVLVFRDVSEARRANAARLRLAAIVESSQDAIVGHDLAGRITDWNRGAERLYGYPADEVLGRPVSMLAPAELADEVVEHLERIRRGEHIEHLETVRLRKDGTRVHVALTVSPIRDAEGNVIGASRIVRDVSERQRIDAVLRRHHDERLRLIRELQEQDRRKDEFLAVLAHELRNPLAPLRNGVEVLRAAGTEPAVRDRALSIMERQLGTLVRLVDDLLDVSRISRGKVEMRMQRVALRDVVQAAVETCAPLLHERGHELRVELPEGEILLHADRTRLAQALGNVLTNSVRYSEPGGCIVLSAATAGPEVVLSVRDTGVGIPPAMLNRVFDMFTQVGHSGMESGGLGVGLAIVKRLVELHGGHVTAHSDGTGQGSTFVIRLPRMQTAAEPPAAGAARPGGRSAQGRRILVVDDNLDAAASLTMMLQVMGGVVQEAHDGLEALDRAAAFRPELILMDIGMPDLDGYQTCRRMRSEPWGAGVRIVALTGWGQPEDKRRSSEAGFDGHLVKPVDPAALGALLDSLPGVQAMGSSDGS